MNYGTRNFFQAKITGIKRDSVMCQIDYEVPGGHKMSSVITCDSADSMGLQVGEEVELIIKAINVIPVKK